MTTNTAPAELVTFEISVTNFAAFKARFAKLAKKAEKLGVAAPSFNILQTDKVIPAVFGEGQRVISPPRTVNVITVSGQAPRLEGWIFLASLQHEAGGNIVNHVPGTNHIAVRLDLRTAKANCDHCKINRRRNDTYVVAHVDGTQMQVGRSCLRDFAPSFANNPENIARWAELLSAFVDSCNSGEGDGEGGGGGFDDFVSLDTFLPFVVANIRANGWMSRTAARNSFTPVASTADMVMSSIFPHTPQQKQDAIRPTKEDIARSQELLAAVQAHFEAHAADVLPDYEHNLRMIVEGNAVNFRKAGLAASIVPFAGRLIGREIERARIAKRTAASVFVGTVGERRDFVLTVEKTTDINGTYGISTLHILTDDEGNTYKWFASSKALDIGKTYKIKATIKSHDEWKGAKQTSLTRCKCALLETPSA